MSDEQTNHSEQINELAAALAAAQGKFLPIKRSKTVEVNGKTKDGRPIRYWYTYAPLDEILNATRPALSANGLAIIQTTKESDGGTVLKTSLIHSSGQWYDSYKDLGQFEDPQKFGGSLTYYRRYEISTILGVSSEEDDDANGVTGNKVQYKHKPAKPNVDQSTGEVEPAKKPAPAPEAPKTNGSSKPQGKTTENPDTLFAKVQKATNGYYEAKEHLYNTLKPAGGWPNFNDQDDIDAKISIAVDHARERRQQETEAESVAEDSIPF